jgi:hypothetical protein
VKKKYISLTLLGPQINPESKQENVKTNVYEIKDYFLPFIYTNYQVTQWTIYSIFLAPSTLNSDFPCSLAQQNLH